MMATLQLPDLNIALLEWYMTPQAMYVLPKTHLVFQPIDMMQGHKTSLTHLTLFPTPRVGGNCHNNRGMPSPVDSSTQIANMLG